MPFPWKKVRNTKISQLVSDHLESQRRRGHLVVETGFPTSLVDLFVKNRDRLKKPKSSKKKKKAQNIDNSSPFPSSSPFPLYQGPRPSPVGSPLISQTPSSSSLALTPAVSSSSLAANDAWKEADEVDGVAMNKRGVFGAFLRVFFVVVLALGAKKFAVGLTMSAFLLFLAEYVGKNSYRYLVPCSGVKRRLRMIIQSIYQVISFRDKFFYENYESGSAIEGQLGASSGFNNHVDSGPICEIQSDEPMFMDHIQGLRKEVGKSSSDSSELQFEKEFDQLGRDGKSQLERFDPKMMVVVKEDGKEERAISESKKGKRARMKSKIKHLVPRKFRDSKKEKQNFEAEIKPIEGNVVILEEPPENEQGDARNLECDSKLSSSLSRRQDANVQINMICSSGVVCEENLEQSVIREEQKKQRKGNSGYLIICLIVLIGLIGGRLIAFMSIVLWFFMLGSGEKLRRYLKLPVIRSLTGKSC